jgi:outer membrane protein assembly complex protein YaeT
VDSLAKRRSHLRPRRARSPRILTRRSPAFHRWREGAIAILLIAAALGAAPPLFAQSAPPIVIEIRLEQEGQVVTDPVLSGLVETAVGSPLSMRDVRETTAHLMSLNRFEDVQTFSEPVAAGVRIRYVLVPIHAVDRVELRGALGLPENQVALEVATRFGAAPPAARSMELAQALRQFYREHGYPGADVQVRIEETHNPDRATMAVLVTAGRRAMIRRVTFERDAGAGSDDPDIREGQPYDAATIDAELARYEEGQRERGYYEARATQSVEFAPDGDALVTVTLDRGPRVSVAFTGDALPLDDRERLVPVRSEASADEDLLEDANRAIEQYLFARGYRDALVDYTRREAAGELTITFDVRRGRRHIVEYVVPAGNSAVASDDILERVALKPGEPFVQAALDNALVAVRNLYRSRGFSRAQVQGAISEGGPASAPDGDLPVRVAINITEGPRTLIGEVTFEGNRVLGDEQLRAVLSVRTGQPYAEAAVVNDRDRIDLEYRNRGYESVVVEPSLVLSEEDTRADVRFTVSEGPQVLVDHIIIVGNDRISTETIERELLVRPGEPLGYAAIIESRARLSALGLFRRVTIEELRHAGEPRRDVLVRVEEAPPTTLGYGGGVEGGTRLRPTGLGGQAEEVFELAPRGFFEIGRRNMWGKNRSVNLFTRVSLRSRDSDTESESGYGFNEYRIFGTFREPRAFDTRADVVLTGIVDQAIRSSFSFLTREARAEAGMRASERVTFAGRYSFKHTKLFDQNFSESEQPLIDRVFPQVRLSKVSMSVIRDTRDDPLQPQLGRFLVADSEVAARALGSEVGFAKTLLQAFSFHRLPTARRMVLALGARFGVAHGFAREVERLDGDGQPILDDDGDRIVDRVQDLPASERFFAGGDTTVRGFSLDRLGTSETISAGGFPTGGNGLIVLNAELRVTVFGPVDVVTFTDAGNVFLKASSIDLFDLRPAAGFGVHYRSPVGPVRVELGFNLDRQELVPGQLERAYVLHISLGQAF